MSDCYVLCSEVRGDEHLFKVRQLDHRRDLEVRVYLSNHAVQCDCRLFEFRGILCHIPCVRLELARF